jgi:hypothetical protein
MKTVASQAKVFPDWWHIALGLVLVFAPLISRAETQVYSEDDLVRIGNDVYMKGDYIGASLFLFAYIQKNPALMTSNPDFANQVQRNYQYSLDQVRKAWSERDQLRAQVRQPAGSGIGSTSSGLTQAPPPPLKIPPNMHMRGADKVVQP